MKSYAIGPAPARESYLNQDSDGGSGSGADALHPGTILAEKREFASV